MRALTAAVVATFLCVGGAWGADCVAEGDAYATRAVAASEPSVAKTANSSSKPK